jgi:hypothetical protein
MTKHRYRHRPKLIKQSSFARVFQASSTVYVERSRKSYFWYLPDLDNSAVFDVHRDVNVCDVHE